MQQHPIPQNVTQYQFRLVGDMTLKQFLELAGGLALAYLFYASNLIFIIKWPLALLSILAGIGLAFFPLEDRPLDMWIINFVKAIYTPTRFIWKKTNKIPRLFLFSTHTLAATTTVTKTIKAPVPTAATDKSSDLTDSEAQQIASVDTLFAALPAPINPAITTPAPAKATIKSTEAIHKLRPQVDIPQTAVTPIPRAVTPPAPPIAPAAEKAKAETVLHQAPSIPSAGAETTTTAPPKQISLPASPKLPNLITGVIVDQTGKLVENAIIQIVSADGIPARAMKTNSLGQFYTSTPLAPGTYIIEVEGAGLEFTPQQIVINNTILSPIELHAATS